jgi:hypothetical protein
VTADQIAEVEKMLGCGDPRHGFTTYICLECGKTEHVPFSYESRVCSSCGKVYVVDAAALRAAQKNPERYRDLIVRVAGYSDYFCDLSQALQDEIIARTEHMSF